MRFHPAVPLMWVAVVAGCRADARGPSPDAAAGGERATAAARADSARRGAESETSSRRTEATPVAPAETRRRVTLPEGTALRLVFRTAVSSATSRDGDLVVAELGAPVRAAGRVVWSAGTEVRGRVVRAVPSGRVKGRARLVVQFDQVVAGAEHRRIRASAVDITAEGSGKRDAAIVGGGAGAGAVIGGIAGGKKGAVVGGVTGAGVGTGVVLATKGKEVHLPAGFEGTVRLTERLTLG